MKPTIAREYQLCIHCMEEIKPGTRYWSGPYQSFCMKCGTDLHSGKISYDRKKKIYIDVVPKSTCDYCKQASIGIIRGKSVCEDHIGNAI